MPLRFTPTVTALCRWWTPQHPQVLTGCKLRSTSIQHIRWSSSSNRDTSSGVNLYKTPRDCTVSTSLDQSLELRGIEILAFRDGGHNALNILKSLKESDGNRMVIKGIICLQAYHDRINILSVEEAEKVIAVDNAGKIVHDWVRQPSVWEEIESNHIQNETLLQLVTYILVGAKLTVAIETWIGDPGNIEPETVPEKLAFEKYFRWKSIMMTSTTTTLISWHPKGLADDGYDFFSRKFDESWLDAKINGNFNKFSFYLWLSVTTALEIGYIAKKHPASSKSFERCANRIVAYWRTWCPPGSTLQTGIVALHHPNRPCADQYLAAMVEIYRDRDHPLRSYWQRPLSYPFEPRASMYKYARFIWATGEAASRILKTEGRYEEGALVRRIVYEIWGDDGEFLSSKNLYLQRLGKWKRNNQEIMRSLHPKFYVPYVF